MRKVWLIARREYLYNFRRRSFLFTAFGVPAFTFLMLFVVFNLVESSAEETGQLGHIGYVDLSGVLDEPVESPEEYVRFDDEAAAAEALAADEIGAYFVITGGYLGNGQVNAYAYDGIPEGIENQLEDFLRANVARLVPAGVPVERLTQPMDTTYVVLSEDRTIKDESDVTGIFFKPIIFAMIFLMATSTTSQFLMSGVVEEKENRMMEILATSSTPLQMLWGKVLGLGVLGLTQVLVWGIVGLVLLNAQSEGSFLSGLSFSFSEIAISLVYFVLGYFLFGAIMGGIGASVTAEQEGRQFAGVFTMIAVIPLFLLVSFIEDPNGTIPVVASLIPITAPMSVMIRLSLAPIPPVQLIASLILTTLSVIGVVWLAARIFRLGMLMYGKRLTVGEIIGAMRQGRRIMTTAAQAREG